MSTVNTLIIQGIRSYPLDVETRIKFFKPLTLIVGSNGSGKTVKNKTINNTAFTKHLLT